MKLNKVKSVFIMPVFASFATYVSFTAFYCRLKKRIIKKIILENWLGWKNWQNKKLWSKMNGHDQTKKEDRPNLTILQTISKSNFWLLWTIFMTSQVMIGFFLVYQKAFVQNFISDDFFFAYIGLASGILNGSVRVVWGKIYDIKGFKASSIRTHKTVRHVFLLTVPLTGYSNWKTVNCFFFLKITIRTALTQPDVTCSV